MVLRCLARVCIQNDTDLPIQDGLVVHKYANELERSFACKNIPAKGKSEEFTVEYNAGLLATGEDWWFMGFHFEGAPGSNNWIVKPNEVIDTLDKMQQDTQKALIGNNHESAIGHLLASESVAGFRGHKLLEMDKDHLTVIHLLPDEKVMIQSPSGINIFPLQLLPVTANAKETTKSLGPIVTKCTARVCIQNDTHLPIEEGFVVHKFSNTYKESHTFKNIPANCGRSEEFAVHFNIGLLETGQDWWFMGFNCNGDKLVVKPNEVIDTLDEWGQSLQRSLRHLNPEGSVGHLLNNESVSGFRGHVLREMDKDQLTIIHILSDSVICLVSHSGTTTFPLVRQNILSK